MENLVKNLSENLLAGFIVSLYEPCNCEEIYGRILHNNGGNYHEIIHFKQVEPNLIRVRFSSTADFGLLPEEEPIFVPLDEAKGMIQELLEKNYWFSIYRPGE